jgi:3-hydroxyacyl-CoA dehydrogenase
MWMPTAWAWSSATRPAACPAPFPPAPTCARCARLAGAGAFAEIEASVKRLQEASSAAATVLTRSWRPLRPGPGRRLRNLPGGVDRIVAHAELYMGLVEIGVGLLPGGTGCSALWRKVLENIPESVGEVELTKFFMPVFQAIAMAKVSTSAAEARATGFLGPKDRIVFNRDHLIGEAKKEVLRMVDDGYAPPVKRPIPGLRRGGQGMVNAELLNMQAAGYVSEYDAYLVSPDRRCHRRRPVAHRRLHERGCPAGPGARHLCGSAAAGKTMARIDHMLKTGKPLRN